MMPFRGGAGETLKLVCDSLRGRPGPFVCPIGDCGRTYKTFSGIHFHIYNTRHERAALAAAVANGAAIVGGGSRFFERGCLPRKDSVSVSGDGECLGGLESVASNGSARALVAKSGALVSGLLASRREATQNATDASAGGFAGADTCGSFGNSTLIINGTGDNNSSNASSIRAGSSECVADPVHSNSGNINGHQEPAKLSAMRLQHHQQQSAGAAGARSSHPACSTRTGLPVSENGASFGGALQARTPPAPPSSASTPSLAAETANISAAGAGSRSPSSTPTAASNRPASSPAGAGSQAAAAGSMAVVSGGGQPREALTYSEAQKVVEIDVEGGLCRLNIEQPLSIVVSGGADLSETAAGVRKPEPARQSDRGGRPSHHKGRKARSGKVDGSARKWSDAAVSGQHTVRLPEAIVSVVENYDACVDASAALSTNAPFQRPVAYYRFAEKSAEELHEMVEYDMDEEDTAWLEIINRKRKKQGITTLVSGDTFELLMDRLEKESYFQAQNGPYGGGTAIGGTAVIDDDAVCAICQDGECHNANAILFCDMCNLAVHQECYGVPYIPEGQWLCRRCLQSPSRAVDCVLCPNRGGAFKQTSDGRWGHVVCALWVPEVYFANTVFLEPIDNIRNIPAARWKLTCYVCKKRGQGACIQCHKANCYTAFHVTCAQQAGLYMELEECQKSGGSASGGSSGGSHDGSGCNMMGGSVSSLSTSGGSVPAGGVGGAITTTTDSHSAGSEQTAVRKTAFCDSHAPASYRKAAKRMRNARKILQERARALPVVVSIPTIPPNRMQHIASLVSLARKSEFLQRLVGYWTLKRQSRNGVPLLRRLQMMSHLAGGASGAPTASSGGSGSSGNGGAASRQQRAGARGAAGGSGGTGGVFSGSAVGGLGNRMGGTGSSVDTGSSLGSSGTLAMRDQLKYWQRLRQDLERARLLCELIRKREKLKRESVRVREQFFHADIEALPRALTELIGLLQTRDPRHIFSQPVDTSAVPDYLTLIREPMDFSTMLTKAHNLEYRSFADFERDFDLVVSNCMIYNAKDTIFYRAAVKLRDQGGAIIRAHRDALNNDFNYETGRLRIVTPTSSDHPSLENQVTSSSSCALTATSLTIASESGALVSCTSRSGSLGMAVTTNVAACGTANCAGEVPSSLVDLPRTNIKSDVAFANNESGLQGQLNPGSSTAMGSSACTFNPCTEGSSIQETVLTSIMTAKSMSVEEYLRSSDYRSLNMEQQKVVLQERLQQLLSTDSSYLRNKQLRILRAELSRLRRKLVSPVKRVKAEPQQDQGNSNLDGTRTVGTPRDKANQGEPSQHHHHLRIHRSNGAGDRTHSENAILSAVSGNCEGTADLSTTGDSVNLVSPRHTGAATTNLEDEGSCTESDSTVETSDQQQVYRERDADDEDDTGNNEDDDSDGDATKEFSVNERVKRNDICNDALPLNATTRERNGLERYAAYDGRSTDHLHVAAGRRGDHRASTTADLTSNAHCHDNHDEADATESGDDSDPKKDATLKAGGHFRRHSGAANTGIGRGVKHNQKQQQQNSHGKNALSGSDNCLTSIPTRGTRTACVDRLSTNGSPPRKRRRAATVQSPTLRGGSRGLVVVDRTVDTMNISRNGRAAGSSKSKLVLLFQQNQEESATLSVSEATRSNDTRSITVGGRHRRVSNHNSFRATRVSASSAHRVSATDHLTTAGCIEGDAEGQKTSKVSGNDHHTMANSLHVKQPVSAERLDRGVASRIVTESLSESNDLGINSDSVSTVTIGSGSGAGLGGGLDEKRLYEIPLEPLDLVWAKCRGYPWYPALIIDPDAAGLSAQATECVTSKKTRGGDVDTESGRLATGDVAPGGASTVTGGNGGRQQNRNGKRQQHRHRLSDVGGGAGSICNSNSVGIPTPPPQVLQLRPREREPRDGSHRPTLATTSTAVTTGGRQQQQQPLLEPGNALSGAQQHQQQFLVHFFDAKRTWRWLPRSKLVPLGPDAGTDKRKLQESRKPAERKAVKKAYEEAIAHRCRMARVTGEDPLAVTTAAAASASSALSTLT